MAALPPAPPPTPLDIVTTAEPGYGNYQPLQNVLLLAQVIRFCVAGFKQQTNDYSFRYVGPSDAEYRELEDGGDYLIHLKGQFRSEKEQIQDCECFVKIPFVSLKEYKSATAFNAFKLVEIKCQDKEEGEKK